MEERRNMLNKAEMENLVKQAQNGDIRALSQLYEDYYTPIYRYLYGRLTQKHIAEDLAQTTFLKIYQALPRINVEETNILAYFFTVARNTMIDHFRKKKHDVIYNDEIVVNADNIGIEIEMKEIVNKDTVALLMNLLNDEQREIVTLRFLNDLSTKEIADLMGKNDDAIRQTLSRSMKILRENFKE